jgi:hypothetical protein
MSLTSGMDLEAGATGRDIAEVQKASIGKRLLLAPIGLLAAEAGAQAGVFLEHQLAGFFLAKDKQGKRDPSWRTKVLIGKVVAAVLLYPISAPVALGLAASGGLLHLLLGLPTFAERDDQATKRQRQILKLGQRPLGRFTRISAKDRAAQEEKSEKEAKEPEEESGGEEPAQEDLEGNLAAKLTDPDVLNAYSRAAEMAWERLVQQGHIPPNVRPVINDAMVREVESLVRDAQQRKAG